MRGLGSILVVLACCVAIAVGFSASGNKILDPSGKQTVLRGIARPSLEWNAAGEKLGLSDYQLMKNWGANVVRLSLSQCFYLPGNVGYNSAYADTVDKQVRDIKSLGLAVILDLHWSNKGNSGTGCGQQRMADSISSTFWQKVATKYKNDPWVIFELYNEPFSVSWSIAKSGGDTGDGYVTPGFQSLYNTVRATGADNLVIIGGVYWAYDLSQVGANPVTGTNIAYCTHPYDTPERGSGTWQSTFGYLASKYPIVMTEFGGFDCGTKYVSDLIAFAEANCISWTGWGWFVKGCDFPSLITDWNGTPSAPGQVVKNALAKPKTCGGGSVAAATTASAVTTGKSSSSTTGKPTTTGGSSSNDIQAYSDSVLLPFQDWSWATVKNPADKSLFQSGIASYSFQPSNYGSLYFYYPSGIDTSKHAAIEWFVNCRGTSPKWKFNLVRYDGANSNKVGPDQLVETYCASNPNGQNAWVKCTASLSAWPAGTYDGFWFLDQSGGTQPTVYVDSVRVIGK